MWYCIPSARPPVEAEACLSKWRAQGYHCAIWRDGLAPISNEPFTNTLIYYGGTQAYPGYARAVNHLVELVLKCDPDCDWVVTGGDDVSPDGAHTADEIAAQCSDYFRGGDCQKSCGCRTYGVMQPTGHRWGDDAYSRGRWPDAPAYIDRIAGSPWIGRSFAQRINGGKGPFWSEYRHCWSDQELQEVATKLGVFWQRRDLVHLHNHWMLKGEKEPPHLIEANKTYLSDKPLFTRRQAANFPGHEPLA